MHTPLLSSGALFPMAIPGMTEAQQEQQQQLASEVSTAYEPTTTIWIRSHNQLCDTPPAEENRLPFFSHDHYNCERIVPNSRSQRWVDSMGRYRRRWRGMRAHRRIAAISNARRPLAELTAEQNWRSSGDSWPPPMPRRTRNRLRKRQRPDGC
ncbi:hypothetical protein FPHYL_12041 [Fusarium phyllophilum]|uniref:Uncharacterized protein n=1 Tax=Fusarium phyllophilum TaxID=47803 RepID=A0A8H5INL4_9HYPO|nr:hypothetical protein FPHYL_12041 [Fusarium phyllophilum]